MTYSTTVIYIPGLGDRYDPLRSFFIKLWRYRSTGILFIPMKWRSGETYPQKMKRIEDVISAAQTDRIVLLGESAGGAISIAASARFSHKINKVVTICGKNVRADRVAPSIYRNNPAFKEVMLASDRAVGIGAELGIEYVTFAALADPTVQRVDTKLSFAEFRRIPMVGHFITIAFVLAIYWPVILREAARTR